MERKTGYRNLVAKRHGDCPLGKRLWKHGNNVKMDIGQVVKIGSRWNWPLWAFLLVVSQLQDLLYTAVDTLHRCMAPGFKKIRAFIRLTTRPAVLIIAENQWVSGLCPSSGIIHSRKQNVSDTAYLFIFG
jgi:hypothetical protein